MNQPGTRIRRVLWLFILSLGALTSAGTAQIHFEAPESVPIDGPFDTPVLADFNLDGHLDLVGIRSAIAGEHRVRVRYGNGRGQFNPASPIYVGNLVGGLAAGDLDEDGRPDIVLTDRIEDEVVVYLKSSILGFRTAVRYDAGDSANRVLLHDLNGDGHLDVGIFGSAIVLVFPGDGTGALGVPVSSSTFGFPTLTPMVGDFDEDGIPDIQSVPSRRGRVGGL